MENNLVATCYVIENRISKFVRPTVYLNEQPINTHCEKLHRFYTVFQAKNFIRKTMGYGVAIEVSKDRPEIKKEIPAYLKIVRFSE